MLSQMSEIELSSHEPALQLPRLSSKGTGSSYLDAGLDLGGAVHVNSVMMSHSTVHMKAGDDEDWSDEAVRGGTTTTRFW